MLILFPPLYPPVLEPNLDLDISNEFKNLTDSALDPSEIICSGMK